MNLKGDVKKFKAAARDSKKNEELPELVEITPLRDFPSGIHHNEIHIDNIKEGVPVTIPRMFLSSMVTEGVIDKLPKEG